MQKKNTKIKNKGRILVCGDIHGNHKGFKQALERANFNNEIDTLISLGDVVDGHCDSYEVVEELLKIKNLIAIKGNHDDWFLYYLNDGKEHGSAWTQGALATGMSYLSKSRPEEPWYSYKNEVGTGLSLTRNIKLSDIPKSHVEFFRNQLSYYVDDKKRLFVHGGFNRHYPIETQGDILWWDRDLWSQALTWETIIGNDDGEGGRYKPRFTMHGEFKEVFIGHTSTQFWDVNEPMHAANIWNLDTGGGWFGYVTIMDVDTKEFWQSDNAKSLYPEFSGRK